MSTTMSTRKNLNLLGLSDVYSLMLFVLYKVQDIPEYAVLSELCYLLDGRSLTRLFTYFSGKTIVIPTQEEFTVLTNALLLYQKVNLDGKTFTTALSEATGLSAQQKTEATELYVKLIPIMNNYNVNRAGACKDER